MARTIKATLVIADEDAPPTVRLTVHLDSVTLVSRDLAPGDAAAAIAAIASLAPEAAKVWEPAVAIVAQLQLDVEQGVAEQAAREQALTEWSGALQRAPDVVTRGR